MSLQTIIGRTNTGAFTQTIYFDSNIEFSTIIAKKMLDADNSTEYVEIYEGRFKNMDFQMKPFLYIYRNDISSPQRIYK
jgi:deoxyadenosine/deoxycytidine kinase